MNKPLSINHWTAEGFRQRMPARDWRKVLLAGDDRIMAQGYMRRLVAKKVGFGVVEISKAPLEEST